MMQSLLRLALFSCAVAACATDADLVARDPEIVDDSADAVGSGEGFQLPAPYTQDVDGRRYQLNTPLFPHALLTDVTPAQKFQLKTGPSGIRGKTVMLPFTYTGSGMLAVGTADTAKLRAILRPHGVEPLPIDRYPLLPVVAPTPEAQQAFAGRSFIEIYGNNYEHSSAGPISPAFVVAYVVNPRDPAGPPGMIFLDYFASTPMAQYFGIEAWGTMKRLADTQSQFAGSDRGFRAAYEGTEVLTMKLVDAETRLSPETPELHSLSIAITPKSSFGPGQTFNRNETVAKFRLAAFDPARDTFATAGFLKRNFEAMDFRGPLVWGTSTGFEGIYHTDLAQVPRHKNDPVTDGSDPSRRDF